MACVMKIVTASVDFVEITTPTYLKTFDIEANGGRGSATLTNNINEAYKFKDINELFETWRKQSKKHPYRPDGKPNRPLTAYSIEAVTID